MLTPLGLRLLAAIREDIERYGQSVVGCDRLLELISPTDPIQAQFSHIFAVTEQQRWSFEFRNDGTVRFADLRSKDGVLLPWPEADSDSTTIAER